MSNFKMTGEKGGNQNIRWALRDWIADTGKEVESMYHAFKSSKNKTEDEIAVYEATSEYYKKLKKIYNK